MFVEKLDDLPEALRAQFVESEFEGRKGFQHIDTVALKNALVNAKTEKEQLRGKVSEFETKLATIEQQQRAEFEARLEQELEKARKTGDATQLEERLRQQFEDRLKQERESAKEEVRKEYKAEAAKATKRGLIAELSAIGVDDGAREALKYLLDAHVDVDPETGKEFFLDENGGAMAVDKAGAVEAFKKMLKFRRLVDAGVNTSGMPNANGSGGGGAASRKFNEYSGAELSALNKQNPAEYERLKREFYGN